MRGVIKKKNKKGQMAIFLFFAVIAIILVLGLVAGLVISVINWSSETITPLMEGLGTVDSTNVSQAATYTFGSVNSMVGTLTWMGGVIFVIALVTCAGFAAFSGTNTPPIFMGLFFAFLILLIFISIFVSNAYEDLYTSTDDIGTRLQEQTVLSFMILYSPLILSVITIMTGIFIFAKGGSGGGIE